MASPFGFRLGAPSYVFPADIIPNVVRLGPHVDDVELLLFEVDSPRDLPSAETVRELRALAREHALTYTVHLPLDLALAARDEGRRRASVTTARDAIAATCGLDPFAYVIHVRGDDAAPTPDVRAPRAWLDRATRSLGALAGEVADAGRLAVENLIDCPPSWTAALVERCPIGRCLDVGHVLNGGGDPVSALRAALPHLRVVHLHAAVDGRDHLGLSRLDRGLLRRMIDTLEAGAFHGVVTVETFAEAPFFDSLTILSTLAADLGRGGKEKR